MGSLCTLTSAFEVPKRSADEWARINREVAAFERREADRRRRERVERSGIPARYRRAVLDGCPPEVAAWCAKPARPLMLRGEVGLGKTWAACAALIALASERSVVFATLRQVADEARAAEWGENALARYRNAGALCIDDLGKDRMTESRRSLLFEIVKARDESGKPTIYTTNYPWEDMVRRLMVGEDISLVKTITSRLQRCLVVDFKGTDRRLRHG